MKYKLSLAVPRNLRTVHPPPLQGPITSMHGKRLPGVEIFETSAQKEWEFRCPLPAFRNAIPA
ncbi:hypothetical protein [Ruminococcus sp.]|uniref:hypothetical protein n=1 Tax=Ruminococcus sp. TaxID=41978 RepID=UPI00262299F2|nr:hypothetical protein [Ruminococcus sp.]MDD7556732.1 hypothetical protein [Ruminococcus sp.]